jgi:type II secretory pathway pseudopilin PulG
MKLINSKKGGYSLIEMVIYVSLLSAIFLVATNMLLSFSKSYRTLTALGLAEHSAIDSMERITRDLRSATSVDVANSTLGTSPGVLTLVTTSAGVSTTTKFYVQNGVLKVDVNGVYFGPLTLTSASTTSLTFRLLSNTNSDAVKVDMTVQGTVGSVVKSKTYHSTIILHGN